MKRYQVYSHGELVEAYKDYDSAIKTFVKLVKENGERPIWLWDKRTNKCLNEAE